MTFGSRCIIYDLTPIIMGKQPNATQEIAGMDKLLDVQDYVETGIKLRQMKTIKGKSSKDEYRSM